MHSLHEFDLNLNLHIYVYQNGEKEKNDDLWSNIKIYIHFKLYPLPRHGIRRSFLPSGI